MADGCRYQLTDIRQNQDFPERLTGDCCDAPTHISSNGPQIKVLVPSRSQRQLVAHSVSPQRSPRGDIAEMRLPLPRNPLYLRLSQEGTTTTTKFFQDLVVTLCLCLTLRVIYTMTPLTRKIPTAVRATATCQPKRRIPQSARCLASVAPVAPLDRIGFRFGVYPVVGGEQAKPVHTIRVPKFESLEAERAHRKLHHAVALRWLGYNGFNNEGAGGHVTVRDPIMTDHFWYVSCALNFG